MTVLYSQVSADAPLDAVPVERLIPALAPYAKTPSAETIMKYGTMAEGRGVLAAHEYLRDMCKAAAHRVGMFGMGGVLAIILGDAELSLRGLTPGPERHRLSRRAGRPSED